VALLSILNIYITSVVLIKIMPYFTSSNLFTLDVLLKVINGLYDATIIFASVYLNERTPSQTPLQTIDVPIKMSLFLDKITFTSGLLIASIYYVIYFCISYNFFSYGALLPVYLHGFEVSLSDISTCFPIILIIYYQATVNLIVNAPLAASFRKIRLYHADKTDRGDMRKVHIDEKNK
jgi:hypothetical protein